MRKFHRTTLISLFCLSVLGGLGLARKVVFTPDIWLLALLPGLFLLKSRRLASIAIVIALGLGIGLWRGGIYMGYLKQLKDLNGQKVTVEVTATADSIYDNHSQIEFTANRAQLLSASGRRPLAGSFKISGFGLPMVYRGDRLTASAKLFPMRGSNQARMAYAKLEKTGQNDSAINDLTRRFDAGMQSALPEPQASFGLGLLIGQRNTLPTDITNQLIMVGLVHIVAVSGYNLTILVRAAQRIGLRSKYQRLMLSLGLIAAFVLVTGFSASIVRAAAVSVLSLWAWYYGLKIRPIVLIASAAALTALINPFYIWGDLGWYLSFLAFFGILVIAPVVSARLFRKPPKMITSVLLETLSAEVMTLPLIMMTFSQLSLIALAANALVIPLVPLAMLLSAIAAGAGAVVPQFAGWLAWPARILLTYMLDVVHMLANIPSIFIHRSISAAYMLAFYGVVLALLLVLKHKLARGSRPAPKEFAQITP